MRINLRKNDKLTNGLDYTICINVGRYVSKYVLNTESNLVSSTELINLRGRSVNYCLVSNLNTNMNKQNNTDLYAIIRTPLGQGQFKVDCSDSISRTAVIRGRDYRRVWIQPNDIVLLSIREGNNLRADIELKYMAKEIKILKDNGYIDDTFGNVSENVKIDFDQI
ncbi:eukaryotic translation initiation factor 1a [Vairimorpha apis BRL 01]|uniref:Eukaryotic translation initiation factor 1a n=1 Tax=Vairimorpha apis BRL 01 TaxID=1037528 RepID=T0L6B3_9MICR|nr:eukaryotic translation initiation factor 1a [Vairimorpha apis BRL 01]